MVGDLDPGDGRENDRCVAKDHREDEAETDGVEGGVAPWVAGREGAGETEQARYGQPGVAGEQATGDEAGEPLGADIAPGDVVAQQPSGEGEEPAGKQPVAAECSRHEQATDDGDEQAAGHGRRRQEAGQFEALSGNGEDQEKQPPGDGGSDGAGADPEQVADQPAGGAQAEDDGVYGFLAAPGDAAGGDQSERRQCAESLAGAQGGAGEQRNAARAGRQRRQVGPALPDGNGAFKADHGAEKGGDHQRTMQPGRLGSRHVPAEAGEAGQHAAQQREHAEEQQWQAVARRQVGHA